MTPDLFIAPSLMPALPEIVLAVGILLLVLLGAYAGRAAYTLVTGFALALLTGAVILLMIPGVEGETFGGAFVQDAFARLLKTITLLASIAAIAMSVNFNNREKLEKFEYPILILTATLGMMIMISAGDMIALYMGLELQSLSLYVVAAINRESSRATEAGLKYFVLGALSSGMLLYGMSLVYGFTGHVGFDEIAQSLAGMETTPIGFIFGLVFIVSGLSFKISAVPFHMWTPDVYEGAPTPVTAFFAAAPKVAAMAIFMRVLITAFGDVTVQWQQVLVFISIASMALGAFGAIGQTNIKRLMAYSSIGNIGFALVGLAAGTQNGIEGVIIYMTVYALTVVGTFACIMAMRRAEGMVEDISELAGLSRTNLPMALLLGCMMFSLIGIPPFAGFFGKWYVFAAAVEAGLYPLAIIGVMLSVVGAFYYLRLIKVMFFDEPAGEMVAMPGELRLVIGATGLAVMFFAFLIAPLHESASLAAATLF